MLDMDMSAVDMYLAMGLLAKVAGICNSCTARIAEFGMLREQTQLLPEKLVSLLDELRIGGYIRHEENSTGNPYGLLYVTSAGQSWVATFGNELQSIIENAPRSFKVSSQERSTRRGGKRLPPPPSSASA